MKTKLISGFITLFVLLAVHVFAARPLITGLTKNEGPASGGAYVGVLGENFTKSTYFKFGGERVITKRYVSSTLVYVLTTENIQASLYVIAYTPSNPPSPRYYGFRFTNAPPELDRINIDNGPAEGSTVVHYYGRNFRPNLTIHYGENESIRRHFYHSDRMYSFTPVYDLEGADSKAVDVTLSGIGTAVLAGGFTFHNEKPVITRVWPAKGIKQGGTLLRITGKNFRATDHWYIGSSEIQFYIPNNHHQFRYGHSGYVLLQTDAAGDQNIDEALDIMVKPAVENIDADIKPQAFTYTEDPPEFTTVYPNKGFASGSTVYIRGKNISSDAAAHFLKLFEDQEASSDSNRATITHYYHDNLIRVKTPTRDNVPAAGELVDIRMENDNGYAINYHGFSYLDLAPRIHYIYPNNGVLTGQQYAYIRGRNFTNDDMSVTFSNQPDPDIYRVYRSNLMVIKTKEAYNSGNVTVTVASSANGSTTLEGGYHYTDKSPTLSSIWPLADTVAGNRNLYINGENFTPGTTVTIGDSEPIAMNHFYHSRRIRVRTPAHAEGKVDLEITTEFGSPYLAPNVYKFQNSPPVYELGTPLINYISPLNGTIAGGSYVHLYGKDLKKETSVTFNGKPANIRYVHPSGRRITIFTPETDGVGTVDIKTSNIVDNDPLDFTLEDGFNYTRDAPTITMITPAKGFVYGGTYIYLYGENLTKDVELMLGGHKAIMQHFYHSKLARFITAPSTAVNPVTLEIETQFGDAQLTDAFHYAAFPPEISAITPNHGNMSGGNWIRINGSFLTPRSKVFVDGIQVPEDQVRYYHTRYLIAKAPANSTTHHKTVSIRVETEFGSQTNNDAYTYVHPDVTLSVKE